MLNPGGGVGGGQFLGKVIDKTAEVSNWTTSRIDSFLSEGSDKK